MSGGSEKTTGKGRETQAPRFSVPFTRKNYMILGVGVLMLVIGYFFMNQPPHDGFMSLTLAPLILTAAYCVIIPWGILAREKTPTESPAARGD